MDNRIALRDFWYRHRRPAAWTAAALALAGVAFLAYMKLVEGAYIPYNKWDRRVRGSLRVGEPAPDLELPLLDAGMVRLSELWRERSVFLVFGSCT
jgi:hypothetical protein